MPTLAARLPDQGGAAPGIGFAIPSATVKNIAGQLIKYGKVTNSDRAHARHHGPDRGQPVGPARRRGGARRRRNGGAAANAGIRAGDIIVGINDRGTPSLQDLESALTPAQAGRRRSRSGTPERVQSATTAKLGSLGSWLPQQRAVGGYRRARRIANQRLGRALDCGA